MACNNSMAAFYAMLIVSHVGAARIRLEDTKAITPECTDTPGWTNGVSGQTCEDYERFMELCKDGAVLPHPNNVVHAFGPMFKSPEENCCACGKMKATPKPTPRPTAEPTPEPTAQPASCTDTPGWTNGVSGQTCEDYERFMEVCKDGDVVPHSRGVMHAFGEKFNSPEKNCCACGKGKVTSKATPKPTPKPTPEPTSQPPACTDTPGWTNGAGQDCEHYERFAELCKDGKVLPHSRGVMHAFGPMFKSPEKNCCACGKKATPTADDDDDLPDPSEPKALEKSWAWLTRPASGVALVLTACLYM